MLAGIGARRLLHCGARGADRVPLGDRLLARQHDLALAGLGVLLGGEGELVGRPHAVADVVGPGGEDAVLVDELLVHGVAVDDLARDVVPDRQVGVGLEDDLEVGQVRRAVGEGRQVDDHGSSRRTQALVDDARPEHRVHLGHVRAPQHDRVGQLDVVVAARRLVDPEGLHERRDRRGHAVARVGIDVVRAPAGLDQLDRGVAFLDRVLARAHDADAGRSEFGVDALELALHLVEGALPADRRELALLVELAVLHAQQRPGQAVLAVGDLGVGVALDAEQAAVDRAVGVALDRDDPAVLGGDLDPAADAAEAADALVPGSNPASDRGSTIGEIARPTPGRPAAAAVAAATRGDSRTRGGKVAASWLGLQQDDVAVLAIDEVVDEVDARGQRADACTASKRRSLSARSALSSTTTQRPVRGVGMVDLDAVDRAQGESTSARRAGSPEHQDAGSNGGLIRPVRRMLTSVGLSGPGRAGSLRQPVVRARVGGS